MTRSEDVEGQPADHAGQLPLDPRLQRAFEDAFLGHLSLDVAARHLWRIDRRGRSVTARSARPDGWRRTARTACLAAVALCVPGLIGQASLGALPGDVLYPVKRQYEDVQVRTAESWSTRDAVLLAHARQRLLEARAIAKTRPRRVLDVVAHADAALSQLERSPQLGTAEVDALRSQAVHTMAELSTMVDDDTADRLHAAMEGFGNNRPPRALALDGGDDRGARSPTSEPPATAGPVAGPEDHVTSAEPAGAGPALAPPPMTASTEPAHPRAADEAVGDSRRCSDQFRGLFPRPMASAAPVAADEVQGATIPSPTAQVTTPPADVIDGCGGEDGDPVVLDDATDPPPPADPADVPTAAAPAPVADLPGGVPDPVSTDGADE